MTPDSSGLTSECLSIDSALTDAVMQQLSAIAGVLAVRYLPAS